MCASCPRDMLSFANIAKLDRLFFRRACPVCNGTRWLQVRGIECVVVAAAALERGNRISEQAGEVLDAGAGAEAEAD